MALTTTQQAEMRRFMGYPDIGQPVGSNVALASLASAWRFLDPIGYFEQRIQTLSQDAEVQLFGKESAFWNNYIAPIVPPGISWTDPKTNIIYNGYIPTLRVLEGDVVNTRRFLGFLKADVVDFRPNEQRQRAALYNYYRGQVSVLLAMPLDPKIIPRNGRNTFRRR
jgi:hypothetical protein